MVHFKHGAVEGEVREATIGDDLHAQMIEQRLTAPVAVGAWGLWKVFARLCSQTCQATGMPYDPCTLHDADQPTLEAAYQAFLAQPKRLRLNWEAACDEADRADGDTASTDPNV